MPVAGKGGLFEDGSDGKIVREADGAITNEQAKGSCSARVAEEEAHEEEKAIWKTFKNKIVLPTHLSKALTRPRTNQSSAADPSGAISNLLFPAALLDFAGLCCLSRLLLAFTGLFTPFCALLLDPPRRERLPLPPRSPLFLSSVVLPSFACPQ